MKLAGNDYMGRAAHLPPRVGLRWLVGALLALVLAAPAPAGAAAAPLGKRLAKALAVPHVQASRTGVVAVDLRTGETVFSRNEQLALQPASVEKLAVAYAALHELGAEFRIETDVLGDGALEGTTWKGNLVLKGYGDPTLSRDDLRTLARGVRAFGIRRVTGGVVGDESYFDTQRAAAGWKPWYLTYESAPLSALIVDRGRWARGVAASPALVAAQLFRVELRAAGVAVTSGARVGTTNAADLPLAFVHSPTLFAIARYMGVESDNFTAEMLLKQLGAQSGGRGTSARGAATVTAVLRFVGVPLGGVRVVDGSGLSLLNRLTAVSLVTLLQAAWIDPALRPRFVSVLPVAGVNGTLKSRLHSIRGLVHAKTGTTRAASSLAGYVAGRYAFAILHNGRPVSTFWARRAQDRFVLVLARS
jgi:D-alanyl-D-alanine carboxypeptidase/D-alanyl-D-alanine-endopeptidase (penicillin-binding protein 4)